MAIKRERKVVLSKLTPLKAMREKCRNCMCWNDAEVDRCPSDGKQTPFCTLYPFRFGRDPKTILGVSNRKSNPKAMEALKRYRMGEAKSNA